MLRLDAELASALTEEKRRSGVTVSDFIRAAIREKLARVQKVNEVKSC